MRRKRHARMCAMNAAAYCSTGSLLWQNLGAPSDFHITTQNSPAINRKLQSQLSQFIEWNAEDFKIIQVGHSQSHWKTGQSRRRGETTKMGPAVVVPAVMVWRPLCTGRHEAIRWRVLDVVAPHKQLSHVSLVVRSIVGGRCARARACRDTWFRWCISCRVTTWMIPAQRFQDYSTSHDFQFQHLVRGSVALVNGSATDIFYPGPAKMCGARHGEGKSLGHEARSGLSAPIQVPKGCCCFCYSDGLRF
jgi:hypothetical protein